MQMPPLTVEDNTMLVQPNTITRAHYNVTKQQKHILLMALGHLNTNLITTDKDKITLDIKSMYEQSGSKDQFSHYVETIKKSLDDLIENRNILRYIENGVLKKRTWLTGLDNDPELNTISLYLSEKIAEIFSQINGNYTQYFLKNTFALKSVYSMRLYEILMQDVQKYRQVPTITILEFRKLFGLEEKYKSFKQLNQNVITKAIADINKHTDIFVNISYLKTRYTVTSLKFTFSFKNETLARKFKTDRKNKFKIRDEKSLEQKKSADKEIAKSHIAQILKTFN